MSAFTPLQPVIVRWGLIPSWSKDGKRPIINACAETVAEKPSFRSAFKRRRCLIPADGFYEWGARKQPHHIRMRSGKPFAMAGLWERWGEIETCTIITTGPNELIAELHDRMPVILPRAVYDVWLDPDVADVAGLLVPYPADEMTMQRVSTAVNNVRNDTPACLEPNDD